VRVHILGKWEIFPRQPALCARPSNRAPVRNPVMLFCLRGGMARDNVSRWA
jgi:hypothetical protein